MLRLVLGPVVNEKDGGIIELEAADTMTAQARVGWGGCLSAP